MKWILIPALLLCAAPAHARLTEIAKVRYDTSEGSTSWQETDVSFLTGEELNELTYSLKFNAFKSYATIFFGRGSDGQTQIAVIRIDEPTLICGIKFEATCLPYLGKMKGPDQEGRVWEICTAFFC